MAELFRTLALQLISEKCYETYFFDNNFFDGKFPFMYRFTFISANLR